MNVPNISASVLTTIVAQSTPSVPATTIAPDPVQIERDRQTLENDLYTTFWNEVEEKLSKKIKRTSAKDLEVADAGTITELKNKALDPILASIAGLSNVDDATKANLATRLQNTFDRAVNLKMGKGVDRKENIRINVSYAARLAGGTSQFVGAVTNQAVGLSSGLDQALELNPLDSSNLIRLAAHGKPWQLGSLSVLNNATSFTNTWWEDPFHTASDAVGLAPKFENSKLGSLATITPQMLDYRKTRAINALAEAAVLHGANAQVQGWFRFPLATLDYTADLSALTQVPRFALKNPNGLAISTALSQTLGVNGNGGSESCDMDAWLIENGYTDTDGNWIKGDDANGDGIISGNEEKYYPTDEELEDQCNKFQGTNGNPDGMLDAVLRGHTPSTLNAWGWTTYTLGALNFTMDATEDFGLPGLIGSAAVNIVGVPATGYFIEMRDTEPTSDLRSPDTTEKELRRAALKQAWLQSFGGVVGTGLGGVAVLGGSGDRSIDFSAYAGQAVKIGGMTIDRIGDLSILAEGAATSGTSKIPSGVIGATQIVDNFELATMASTVFDNPNTTPLQRRVTLGTYGAIQALQLGGTFYYTAGKGNENDGPVWKNYFFGLGASGAGILLGGTGLEIGPVHLSVTNYGLQAYGQW